MRIKRFMTGVGVLVSLTLSLPLEAGYREDLLKQGLPIVNSVDEKDVLPGGFRMTKVITLPTDNMPSSVGLADLKMSGSSQFSEHSLEALVKRTGAVHLTVVNLRQEDGGFIEPRDGNGAVAFSYLMPMPWWTGEDRRGNRSIKEIEVSELERMNGIMKEKTFTFFGTNDSYAPTDTHKILYKVDIDVKRALTEKQLVEEKGLGYFRIPDKKFGNMEFEHVDLFVEFVKNLPADEWVHFHCKKGQSRTTLFMIMYDMMRNAEHVSASVIIERQGPRGLGGADLSGMPARDHWDHSFKKGWNEFLYQFHTYVKDNKPHGFVKSWSVWAAENRIAPPPPVALGEFYKVTTVESALPGQDEEAQEKVLIFNVLNESKLQVQNFRSTQDLWLSDNMARIGSGLKNIYASGSNQYSRAGMALLVEKIKKFTDKVVVVDLRHDDHLFVNGLNVSSFETKDAMLKPRTPEDIKGSVNKLKEEILGRKRITAYAIDTKYPKNDFSTRFKVQLVPDQVETPEEFISSLGAHYLLIGSKRFSEASDEDVDRFIEYMRGMPKDTWYHFHCKKGKSRTTLFMTLLDMLHNADHQGAEEIIERERLIGGINLLDVTPKDPDWPHERDSKKQWVVLLLRFHRYAAENKAAGFVKPWSQWSAEHADFVPEVGHLLIDRSRSKAG